YFIILKKCIKYSKRVNKICGNIQYIIKVYYILYILLTNKVMMIGFIINKEIVNIKNIKFKINSNDINKRILEG
ncbi:hypothetical protein FC869_18010, partial [Clostridium botulinum]|nr:hypothetical protein [Clostridium botulinum]